MGGDLREGTDIAFVRSRRGSAHVCDSDALDAACDGRGVFDVDPHCRKLEAFVNQHKLQVHIVCEEMLPGDRPVYFTLGWTRRGRAGPPKRPAAALTLGRPR